MSAVIRDNLRGRGWVILVCVALVAGLAAGFASLRARSYSAEATMVVPARGADGGFSRAGDASQLAASYAAAIPEDDLLLRSVATRAGRSLAGVRQSLKVTNEAETSIIRLSYEADTEAGAVRGMGLLTQALTSRTPVSSSGGAQTLVTIRRSNRAKATGLGAVTAGTIGAVLGCLLGVAVLVAWNRANPRMRKPQDFASLVDCPVTDMADLSPDSAAHLLSRWRATALPGPRTNIGIAPATHASRDMAEATVSWLVECGQLHGVDVRRATGMAGSDRTETDPGLILWTVGYPGTWASDSGLLATSELSVVTANRNITASSFRQMLNTLAQLNTTPDWVLLSSPVGLRGLAEQKKKRRDSTPANHSS